jgi:hypothetical protein
MFDQFLMILPSVLLATGAGLLGGIIALFWSPGVWARSAIQHFAAGAVLSAVASSVIPEAESMGSIFGVLGGFAAGGLAMIALKWVVVALFVSFSHITFVYYFYLCVRQIVFPPGGWNRLAPRDFRHSADLTWVV